MSFPPDAKLAAVFLDFEGTLNDSGGTGRLYARSFVLRMSREHRITPEVWVRALGLAMDEVRRFQTEAAEHMGVWSGYDDYRRRELTLWAHTLMQQAGLAVEDDDQALAWSRRLEEEIPLEMAPLPGALEAVPAMSADGWRLFITSGAPSYYTRRCLAGVGLAGCFEKVYGPDILDTLKNDPEYFRRAFRDAGLAPSECVVVDDSAGPLDWAIQAGAGCVVAVGDAASEPGPGISRVRNLTELPGVLRLLKR